MVRYGKHDDKDDVPTSMHVKRVERKYRGHKLSRAIGDTYVQHKHDHPPKM
jgi:hypothetical protein